MIRRPYQSYGLWSSCRRRSARAYPERGVRGVRIVERRMSDRPAIPAESTRTSTPMRHDERGTRLCRRGEISRSHNLLRGQRGLATANSLRSYVRAPKTWPVFPTVGNAVKCLQPRREPPKQVCVVVRPETELPLRLRLLSFYNKSKRAADVCRRSFHCCPHPSNGGQLRLAPQERRATREPLRPCVRKRAPNWPFGAPDR